jgi:hypothetical protein
MNATLAPDLNEARRFLDLLGEGMLHRFQSFCDRRKGERILAGHEEGDLDDMLPWFMERQSRGYGIYFTVNESVGGRSTEHITSVRALFLDLDGSPLQPVLETGFTPHAIIESSPGKYQVFWLVADCPLERFSALQNAIAMKFKGDPSIHDLPRVMRIPGFYHLKGDPWKVKTMHLEHFLPYKLDTIIGGLGIAELEELFYEGGELPELSEVVNMSLEPSQRHNALIRYAGRYARRDMSFEEVYFLVQGINQTTCKPPKPKQEIMDIVSYVIRKNAAPPVDISSLTEHQEEEYGGGVVGSVPESLVTGAPGLVGAIADWITDNATRYQPHFAFAAALAFVGTLKGHRVQTERGLRTNHMTLALGESGSGKSDAGKRLTALTQAAGLTGMSIGTPASDSALRGAISNHGARAFLFWDEMGLALENMLSKNSASYHKAIKDLMVELWSKADTILYKKELISQESQKLHKDIDQPCLGLFATAQPSVFFGALSSSHSADGFYPRLLVFETPNNYPAERDIVIEPPPHHLIDKCKLIEDWPTNVAPRGRADFTIAPRVIPMSPQAKALLVAARADAHRNLVRSAGTPVSGIAARTVEHIEKIALTVEDGDVLTADSMTFAIDLMVKLSETMASSFRLRVSDSSVEKVKKKVLQVIHGGGRMGVTTTHLNRKTQFLRDKRERETVLSELEAAGLVYVETETTPGRNIKRWFPK